MARRGDTTMRIRITGASDEAVRALRDLATEMARTDARYKDVAEAFVRESDKIEAKAKQTADQVEAQQRRMSDRVQGAAVSRVGGFASRLPGGGLLDDLGGADALLAGVGAKAAVATAGVAALGVAAAKAGQLSVQAFTSVADSVQQFSNLTGKSAEESSGWALALEAVGLGTEQWIDRVRQFQTNLAQFPHRAEEAGVAVVKMADGTVDASETMLNALQKLHDTPDILERQRIGFQLFGESWTQLMPIIRDPSAFEALRKNFEGALSEKDLDKLNEFQVEWAKFQTHIKLAGAEIGSALVPTLTDLIQAAEPALPIIKDLAGLMGDLATIGADQIRVTFEVIGDVRGLLDAIPVVGDVIKAQAANYQIVRDTVHNLAESTKDMTAAKNEEISSWDRSRVAAQQAAAAYHQAADGVDDYHESLQMQVSAQARAARVVGELGGLREAAAKASTSLQDAQARGAEQVANAEQQAARQIASAQQQVEEAHRSAARAVEQAERRVADALEARQEAVARVAEAEQEAAELVADANEDAARRVLDAQRRVDDAREDALRNRRDNNRRIEDADLALQEALNRALLEENPFEAQRIREEALRKRERVNEDVAESELDAARRVQEAEEGLRDAHVEAAERRADAEERAGEIITAALKAVEDANRRVEDAQASLAQAAEDGARRVEQAEQNLRSVTEQANAARSAAANSAAAAIWNARMLEVAAAEAVETAERRLAGFRLTAPTQRAMFQATWDAQDPNNSLTRVTSRLPGRASGGPVHAGGAFVVGEDGPELLVMGSQGGRVVPNGQLGGNTYIIQGSVISERELVEIIARAERGGYGR